MHNQVEIEIKSLLGDQATADTFLAKLLAHSPQPTVVETSKQLNHYFVGTMLNKLVESVAPFLTEEARAKLSHIAQVGKKFSVRTRQQDTIVLLVVKASLDETTSENGISRLEFEQPVTLTLDELDTLILTTGYTYQAKWSRARTAYRLTLPDTSLLPHITIALDKNAGYGYLTEFEAIVANTEQAPAIKNLIQKIMTQFGVRELSQDQLARMFAFYNEHWQEYYGTDKTFTIT